MPWHLYLTDFFGGALLANAIPHLATGLARRPFPSPFASPPFKGLSSPAVNIAWGLGNLAAAYLLLSRITASDVHLTSHVIPVAIGFGVMAAQLVRTVRRLRSNTTMRA